MSFRATIDELSEVAGQGTRLVSLYLPPDKSLQSIVNRLRSEHAEAEQIKSKHTRKGVQRAITIALNELTKYSETPESGVAIFAGVDKEDREWDKTIEPPEPITSFEYRCDSEFYIEPLEHIFHDDTTIGLVIVERRAATLGRLVGDQIEHVVDMESDAKGQHGKGGFCLGKDELIPLSTGNIIPIEEVTRGDEVFSVCDKNEEIVTGEVQEIYNTEQPALKVKTNKPSGSIIMSPNHEVLTTTAGGVVYKEIQELSVKDKLIVPKSIDVGVEWDSEINWEKYTDVVIVEDGEPIRTRFDESNKIMREVSDELGVSKATLRRAKNGRDIPISTEVIKNICEYFNINTTEFLKRNTVSKNNIPEEITEDLAYIVGYISGDGWDEGHRLRWVDERKEVVEEVENKFKRVFPDHNTSIKERSNKGYYRGEINGVEIVSLFRDVFPEMKKSHNTKVPEKIVTAPGPIVSSYLKGIYDAEGWVMESGIGFGVSNEHLCREIQLLLLRFGIIPSLGVTSKDIYEYATHDRWAIWINDGNSIENFCENIGLTATDKKEKLENLRDNHEENSRRIPEDGRVIRDKIYNHYDNLWKFKNSNMYLSGNRNISIDTFYRNIIDEVEYESLQSELLDIVRRPYTIATIQSIEEVGTKEMVDLSVNTGNFVCGKYVVHNSQGRFDRLEEEATQNFYEKVAEEAADEFSDVQGLVVGGSNISRDEFTDKLPHDIDVIATCPAEYTGEEGLDEVVSRTAERIQDVVDTRARQEVEEFFQDLKGDGAAVYGTDETKRAAEMGAIDVLLLDERTEIEGDLEEIVEMTENRGGEMVRVPDRFEDGERFNNVFGGIGARCRFDPG